MRITNKTGIGIRIEADSSFVTIPAGETTDVISSSGKITIYSDKKTSTRVDEQAIKAFHAFFADIATACRANVGESSEIVIASERKEFQSQTSYEYFVIECNGSVLKNVRHEVCDADKVLSDRKKFCSDHKAEKNVNSILGFLDKADDLFSDIMLILLIGLFSLPITMQVTSSLIFTGIVLAAYLVFLFPFGGIKRRLGRSNNRILQRLFKKSGDPDDLDYFIKHINKYCK